MCIVSAITDDFTRRLPQDYPWVPQPWTPVQPWLQAPTVFNPDTLRVSREEFEALRNEMLALKELLKAAKIYDAATGQPECEDAGKMATLAHVSSVVGVVW